MVSGAFETCSMVYKSKSLFYSYGAYLGVNWKVLQTEEEAKRVPRLYI